MRPPPDFFAERKNAGLFAGVNGAKKSRQAPAFLSAYFLHGT
jgi:hypothetical protein